MEIEWTDIEYYLTNKRYCGNYESTYSRANWHATWKTKVAVRGKTCYQVFSMYMITNKYDIL